MRILGALLVLSLSACGSDNDNNNDGNVDESNIESSATDNHENDENNNENDDNVDSNNESGLQDIAGTWKSTDTYLLDDNQPEVTDIQYLIINENGLARNYDDMSDSAGSGENCYELQEESEIKALGDDQFLITDSLNEITTITIRVIEDTMTLSIPSDEGISTSQSFRSDILESDLTALLCNDNDLF